MNKAKNHNLYSDIGNFIMEHYLYRLDIFAKSNYSVGFKTDNKVRNEDIDSGICGIVLFLIELYQKFKNPDINKAIIAAGEDLLDHCAKNSRLHFGFYRGRAGVCFTLIKIWQTTNDSRYLKFALDIIKNYSDAFIESEFATNRLYDGRSGLLIVLLHLYDIRSEKWILDKMRLCINIIISNFIPTKDGIIWDRNDCNIKPLTSFLYGSSGVAFALTQYGRYFNNRVIISLAKEIFRYENHYWNNKISCWPGFSKEISSFEEYKIHISKFAEKDLSFFLKSPVVHDIASGTAGQCLARYPLLDFNDKDQEKKNLKKALISLCNVELGNISMINGLSGIALSLLISVKYFKIPELINRIKEIVNLLKYAELSFTDISLFNGITGIGFFLLQTYRTKSYHSVFYPIIERVNKEEHLNDEEKRNADYMSHLFRSCSANTALTVSIIKKGGFSGHYFRGYEKSRLSVASFLHAKFMSSIKNLPENKRMLVLDIYKLETGKIRMLTNEISNSLFYIKRISGYEEKVALLNMSENELSKQTLVFCKETRIVKTGWNWARLDQPGADAYKIVSEFVASPNEKNKLILFRDKNIMTTKIDALGDLTISIFKNPLPVCDAIDTYIEAFDIKSKTEKIKIRKYAFEYIRYFIRRSLLQLHK